MGGEERRGSCARHPIRSPRRSHPISFSSLSLPLTGEKGVGKSGKPLHFKGSTFHRVINECVCVGVGGGVGRERERGAGQRTQWASARADAHKKLTPCFPLFSHTHI